MDTTSHSLSLSAEQRRYYDPHRSDSNDSTISNNHEPSLLTNVTKVFNSKRSDGYSTSSSSPDLQHAQASNDNNRAPTSIQRFTSPSPSLTHSFSSPPSVADSDSGEGSNHGTPRTAFRASLSARPGVPLGLNHDPYGRSREFLPGRIILTTPKIQDPLSFDHILIPTPRTYEELLHIAMERFHIRRFGDITLRCAMKRAGGTTIWADLSSADWAYIIKDGDEIGVFRKDDVLKDYDDRSLKESAQLIASTSYDAYGTRTRLDPIPALQVIRSSDDGKDEEQKDTPEKCMVSFMLHPSKGATSIAEVPDTYEKCQSVARETFFRSNSFIPSTSIVLKAQVDSPSGGKMWSIIHPTAYARMVKQRTGRIDIRVSLDDEQSRNQVSGKPCTKDRTQQQKEAAPKESNVKSPEKSPPIRDSHLKQASLQLNPPAPIYPPPPHPPPPQTYNPTLPPAPSTAPFVTVEPRPFLTPTPNTFPIGGNKNISRSSASSPHSSPTPGSVNRQPVNPNIRTSYPISNMSANRSSSSLSNRSGISNPSPSTSSRTLVSPPLSTTSSSHRSTASHGSNRSSRRSLNNSPHSASDSSSALSHSDSSTTGESSSSYDDGSATSTASTSMTKRSKEYLAPTKASMGKDKDKESQRERDANMARERDMARERERQREKEKMKEPKLKKQRSERSYRDDTR